MKPENWETLDRDEKQDVAQKLFNSVRGYYIISQALYYGIKSLRAVPEPYTEISNAQDMEILQEIFKIPASVFEEYSKEVSENERSR